MVCKVCGCLLKIINTKYEAENDTTPDIETKMYHVQELACTNKDYNSTGNPCSNINKIVETVRHELN